MTTDLRLTDAAPAVTADQLDLITRIVAPTATADELKLYLHDCARQGVHPLDKLIIFTKRGGKYTPVTSIDFMRIRAAETGEYAGSEDAVFAPPLNTPPHPPAAAFVTVYRLVQGQRCAFSATARWSEYKPEQDFMWLKMPFLMLSKCAEALALRKAFPRQLAGLYAKEEMDQAETDSKPALSGYATVQEPPPAGEPAPLPPVGFLLISRVDSHPTRNKNVTRFRITFSDGQVMHTISPLLASLAESFVRDSIPCKATSKSTQWGLELLKLEREQPDEPELPMQEPLDSSEIPF